MMHRRHTPLWGRGIRHGLAVAGLAVLAACSVNVTDRGGPPPPNQAYYVPAGDDGLGGTGIVASAGGDGLGGTGIYGTITAFGSIIVNGLKLDYDTRTIVGADGQPAALNDLRIGQVVQSTALKLNERLYADRLEIQHAVAGPISAIDHSAGRLTVLGQTVLVNADGADMEAFNTLTVGDSVQVSGLRNGAGEIVASRLDEKYSDRRILVRGPATWSSDNTVRVGDLDLTLDDTAFIDDGAREGDVLITGRMIDDKFSAGSITDGAPLAFTRDVETVSVEGLASAGADGRTFKLHGVTVRGEGAGAVEDNARIIVSGRLTVDGAIEIDRLTSAPTFITILRAKGSLRPTTMRPDRLQRPERITPRPERPERPDRPREGPGSTIIRPVT